MFNLMIILLSTINSEPINSNNYKIAKYIIEHIQELEDCTISELAKNCYVSNSSVSRFCRDIGLEDFNDLRMQVAKAPLAYKDARNKFAFKEFSDDFYTSYMLSVIENLKNAFTKTNKLILKLMEITKQQKLRQSLNRKELKDL